MSRQAGFTLLEIMISLCLVILLLSVLLPALQAARVVSQRDQCAANLGQIGAAIHSYLEEHNEQFPSVTGQPAWRYGGVRHARLTGEKLLDADRPLSRWLASYHGGAAHVFCCPADTGITAEHEEAGTGPRTTCQAFGTSYRANAALFDARLAGASQTPRGMYCSEITAGPARLLLLGDAVWYEVYESTGRKADWHAEAGIGNILFLDGSVKFQAIRPRGSMGPVVVDPILPGTVPGRDPAAEDDTPRPVAAAPAS